MNQFRLITSKYLYLNFLPKILIIAIVLFTSINMELYSQAIIPGHYWTFNGAVVSTDSVQNGNLDFNAFGSAYTWKPNGLVGKYITLDALSATIDGADILLDSTLTVEFLFKPGKDFNTTSFFARRDGAFIIRFDWPYINFFTKHTTHAGTVLVDDNNIHLNGTGRKEFGYYADGDWHHMVFKFSANTGKKEVWVDGQLADGFSKTLDPGYFVNTNPNILVNSSTSYRKYFGDIDEIAIYNTDVPSTLIYKHYQDAINGLPYSFINDSTLTVPVADPVSAGIDTLEFPIGHPNVKNNMIHQLQHFPTPRFKNDHNYLPNFQWMNPKYFSGYLKAGISQEQAVANSIQLQTELVTNFNFSLMVNDNTASHQFYDDTTEFTHHWVNLANANPDWKTGAITFWGQTQPVHAGFSALESYILNDNLPLNHYVRNANGDFIDKNGYWSYYPSWSPAAPVDSFIQDGITQRFYLEQLTNRMTRPLDYINENAEVIPLYKEYALLQDSLVVNDKNATGLDWDVYQAVRKTQLSLLYRDTILSLPALSNTRYSEYYISGNDDYLHLYSHTRLINTPINGNYYNTIAFIPRWPSNWRNWIASWAGWQWIVENRHKEIELGDKFFSPFVGAGWDMDPEINMRPAQYLGLLKCVGMAGAEFYYPSFFNLGYGAPFPDPDNYAWQAVLPAYSQGVTTWYDDIFRNGHLMDGDVPSSYINPNPLEPGYSFSAGDVRKLVVARKHNLLNKYAITGTIQPQSNMLNGTEKISTASINIDGSELQFEIRRQGSTYLFDNSNSSNPIFYQLDKWHESTHPERWSNDFDMEAELFQASSYGASIVTEVPAGTLPGDFRTYTTFIESSATDSITYSFTNRINAEYYLWIRARNTTGVSKSLQVILDNGVVQTITCVDDTDWNWYTIKGCSVEALNGLNLTKGEHDLTLILPDNTIQLDRILITKVKLPVLEPGNSTCDGSYLNVQNTIGTAAEIHLTRSKQNLTCYGLNNGTISINVTGGSLPYTYEWSTSPVQTTSSLNNLSSGFYTITVTDFDLCTKKATIEIREPSPLLSIFIPSHPTTPNTGTGSINQLVTGGVAPYTFSWFPIVANTEDLNSVPAGTYFVTTIDANGCAILNATTLIDPPAINGGISGSKNGEITNLINVYPNPFDNLLNIYLESKTTNRVSLIVRDISGRIVYQKEEPHKPFYSLSTSQFNAGLYFLEVQQGDKTNRAKIIKSE